MLFFYAADQEPTLESSENSSKIFRLTQSFLFSLKMGSASSVSLLFQLNQSQNLSRCLSKHSQKRTDPFLSLVLPDQLLFSRRRNVLS